MDPYALLSGRRRRRDASPASHYPRDAHASAIARLYTAHTSPKRIMRVRLCLTLCLATDPTFPVLAKPAAAPVLTSSCSQCRARSVPRIRVSPSSISSTLSEHVGCSRRLEHVVRGNESPEQNDCEGERWLVIARRSCLIRRAPPAGSLVSQNRKSGRAVGVEWREGRLADRKKQSGIDRGMRAGAGSLSCMHSASSGGPTPRVVGTWRACPRRFQDPTATQRANRAGCARRARHGYNDVVPSHSSFFPNLHFLPRSLSGPASLTVPPSLSRPIVCRPLSFPHSSCSPS
ncbi:hypothetical protein B0H19DRAFT_604013 [Mycena capillaripes]|nr:hypothetical protein B0H19DRAFT_604013 [Mycena capillaripes]